jgi:hypothetical protein
MIGHIRRKPAPSARRAAEERVVNHQRISGTLGLRWMPSPVPEKTARTILVAGGNR